MKVRGALINTHAKVLPRIIMLYKQWYKHQIQELILKDGSQELSSIGNAVNEVLPTDRTVSQENQHFFPGVIICSVACEIPVTYDRVKNSTI